MYENYAIQNISCQVNKTSYWRFECSVCILVSTGRNYYHPRFFGPVFFTELFYFYHSVTNLEAFVYPLPREGDFIFVALLKILHPHSSPC